MRITAFAAIGLAVLPRAFANTPLDDSFVQNDVSNNGGLEVEENLKYFLKARA